MQPAIFMSVYYTLTLPEIHFADSYIGARLGLHTGCVGLKVLSEGRSAKAKPAAGLGKCK